MKLLLDLGNTRIKAGWIVSQSGQREDRALAFAHADLKQLRTWLCEIAAGPTDATAALGVNVAGSALAHALDEMLAEELGIPIRWVSSSASAGGILNAYTQPQQLGADRWVAMIGMAQRALARPVLLATFGTATTIDTLGLDNRQHDTMPTFRGGLIFPGPALMRSSLAAGTANLPAADGAVAAYPTDTHQAISTGIAAAQAGALLRQWRVGLSHYGQAPQVYVSGGGWPMVQEEVQRLLAGARSDLGMPPENAGFIASPVLDGLARLASDASLMRDCKT